ncbi:MAG: DnaJ domain-containing protein [Myxococcales bacterium]|nr:DnaJ domain-containing protein [Myxococcales bacterium]
MSDRLDELDYYTLLGVSAAASADELRSAFHRFALKYHPDNHSGGDDARLARATQIFRRGAEAYRVLSSPETRRRYDDALSRGERRLRSEPEPSVRRPASGTQTVNRKAHPFYKKAEQLIGAGDWANAKLQLKIAAQHDPESDLVKAKLAIVEAQLAAKKR